MPSRNSRLPGTFVCLPAHILQKHGLQNLVCQPKEPQLVMQSSVLFLVLWGRKQNVFAGSVTLACIVSVSSVAKLWNKLFSPQPLPLEWLPHTFSTSHPPNHGAMAAAAAKSQTLCDSLVCSPMITFETKHNRMLHALNQLTWPECVWSQRLPV